MTRSDSPDKAAFSASAAGGGRESRRRMPFWLMLAAALAVAAGVAVAVLAGVGESPIAGFRATEAARPVVPPGVSLDDARRLTFEVRDTTIELERRAAAWVLADTGYPVRAAPVDAYLERLRQARFVYVSTAARPALADYNVTDPGTGFAAGTRLTIRDGSGLPLVGLVVGIEETTPTEIARRLTFVRPVGDVRVWLVDAGLAPPRHRLEWVDTAIVNVPRQSVVAFDSRGPQGERLAVRRNTEGELRLTQGLAPPDRIKGPWVLDDLVSVLEEVDFVDVAPAARVFAGGAGAWRTELQTAGGIVYRIELAASDVSAGRASEGQASEGRASEGQAWVQLSASSADAAPASGQADAGQADVSDAVRSFNSRHEGWAYAVSSLMRDQLTRVPEDLKQ